MTKPKMRIMRCASRQTADRRRTLLEPILNNSEQNRHRGRPCGSHPCHTTRHAGPHRAVREIEVMRDGARPAGPTNSGSARR
jgi:hypothetical protein